MPSMPFSSGLSLLLNLESLTSHTLNISVHWDANSVRALGRDQSDPWWCLYKSECLSICNLGVGTGLYTTPQCQLFLSPDVKANWEQKVHKLLGFALHTWVHLYMCSPLRVLQRSQNQENPKDYLILASAPLTPSPTRTLGVFPSTHKFSQSSKLSHLRPNHLSQNLLVFNISMSTKSCDMSKLAEDDFKCHFFLQIPPCETANITLATVPKTDLAPESRAAKSSCAAMTPLTPLALPLLTLSNLLCSPKWNTSATLTPYKYQTTKVLLLSSGW